MSSVELRDVSKRLGERFLIYPASFKVEKGEFVVIVGPSGSGKSTLLRLVAGLETLTDGEVYINNKPMQKVSPAQRDIAMVFQDYALYPHMTVYGNMAYGLKMRQFKTSEIQVRVQAVAERLGLTELLHRKPRALSGGQQQRVAMGRALVREPSLYLFDEPLSSLDVSLRRQMRTEMKQLYHHLKITSLYVTHDQMEAMSLATRILVLNAGRIEQFDTPRMIYQKPANVFVGTFMGMNTMNIIKGVVDKKNQCILLESTVKIPLPQLSRVVEDKAAVLLGLRPEEMSVVYDKPTGQGILVKEQWGEDMGADILSRVKCEKTNQIFVVRRPAQEKKSNAICEISFQKDFTAHLFLESSGERIGGFDGQT